MTLAFGRGPAGDRVVVQEGAGGVGGVMVGRGKHATGAGAGGENDRGINQVGNQEGGVILRPRAHCHKFRRPTCICKQAAASFHLLITRANCYRKVREQVLILIQ